MLVLTEDDFVPLASYEWSGLIHGDGDGFSLSSEDLKNTYPLKPEKAQDARSIMESIIGFRIGVMQETVNGLLALVHQGRAVEYSYRPRETDEGYELVPPIVVEDKLRGFVPSDDLNNDVDVVVQWRPKIAIKTKPSIFLKEWNFFSEAQGLLRCFQRLAVGFCTGILTS